MEGCGQIWASESPLWGPVGDGCRGRMPELGLGPCGQKGGGGAENARRQEGLGTDRLGGGVTRREGVKKIHQPGIWPRN